MSILYIRLPSKAAADSLEPGNPLHCHFALASDAGTVEREGEAALPELAESVQRARRVILMLSASDVTLLRVKVPPMSAGRLRAALPNLIEDQLMSDPAECVVVAGDEVDGLRTVAVVHRGWLELLNTTMVRLGARSLRAVPAQMCLPWEQGFAVAAVIEQGVDSEIALRLGAQEGIGLSVLADSPVAAPLEVMQTLLAVVPQAPIRLLAPQARLADYERAAGAVPGAQERVSLAADDWRFWLEGAATTAPDLMQGLGAAAGPKMNWKPWRWPVALAAGLLLINAIALNVEWLRMKREADALRATMVQTYKAAYPKDQVVVDPLAQMRQKLSAAQRTSGAMAPDDFIALAAATGDALAALDRGRAVAGLEYRDRALSVKLKPGSNVPIEELKSALSTRNLAVTQAGADVLQVRSAR